MYFIEAGVYTEQAIISRPNVRIYGETHVPNNFTGNSRFLWPAAPHCLLHSITAVTITNSLPASVAGSNDASGTIQIHATNVSLYNINIANTYGDPVRHCTHAGVHALMLCRSNNLRL